MNMPIEDSLEGLLNVALFAYAKIVKTIHLTVLSLQKIMHYTRAKSCRSE